MLFFKCLYNNVFLYKKITYFFFLRKVEYFSLEKLKVICYSIFITI